MSNPRINPKSLSIGLVLLLMLAPMLALAKAKEVNGVTWEGVERIVAIGDIHGDYDQYIKVLTEAGLVDKKGKWTGGKTHLVQTGDVPDRGPDTRQIMDHLEKLKKEAKRKGGRVHTLIGNHDAMMVFGDLRYVTPGEFEAFVDKRSAKLQEAQWEHHLSVLEQRDPEGFADLDQDAFRKEWEKDYPLGWVEHRTAWVPTGEYGSIVLENPPVLKINDTLFVHGGLSAKFCKMGLEAMNEQAHQELANYDGRPDSLIDDPLGPLWYRGLAMDDESVRMAMVDAILERYGARRIVTGHSPTQGVVWPRFNGKVVINDLGMAAHYGSHLGFLEIQGDSATAHYAGGNSLPLPEGDADRGAYLEQVIAWDPDNRYLKARLARLQTGTDSSVEAPDRESMSEAELAALDAEEAWLNPDNCRQ